MSRGPFGHLNPRRVAFFATIAVTAALCGLPLFNLARLGLARFDAAVFSDAGLFKALQNTLVLAAATTFFTLAVGTVCGFFLSRTDLPAKKRFKSLLLYPYVIPSIITAIGWVILANPGAGLLKDYLPGLNIYTMAGLVFVETMFWYTYVLLNVANVLDGIDASLEESARMCGAGPLRIFRTVTLPLLRPTLTGSGLVVFLCVASSFGVPAIIGGPGKIKVLTTYLYQLIKIGTPDAVREAMMISVPVIVLAFALIYVSEKILARKAYATLTGKHNRKLEIALGPWRAPAAAGFGLFTFVALGLPFATILVTSFMVVYGDWNLSLENYRIVLLRAETLDSLKNSFALALGGGAVIATLSFFVAYFKEKTAYRFRNTLAAFASLPYATPGTILAMAILFSLTGAPPVALLLLAYVAKYLSQGLKVMSPAIINVDKSLEEASFMCGAGWFKTLRLIWAPVLKGAFSTCLFLMVAHLFSELTMSIMLTGADFPTVGVRLFHLQEYESPNQASVLAVLILVFVVGSNALVKKLSRGRLGV